MKSKFLLETRFDAPTPETLSPGEIVDLIAHRAAEMAAFWGSCQGWAPDSAAALLARSRLDLIESMSRCLHLWTAPAPNDEGDGRLILAWAILGGLVEALLKLLLAVHYTDYIKAPIAARDGTPREPDGIQLEDLRQFFVRESILPEWKDYVGTVQARRNALHFFKSREIGTWDEFYQHLRLHLSFMRAVDLHLPYPDGR